MLLEREIYLSVVGGVLNHRNSESALGIASDGPHMPSCAGAGMVAFCFWLVEQLSLWRGQDKGVVTGGGGRGHCRDPLGWPAEP